MNQIDDLKQLIIHKLDVDEFLDILGYDISDLVERLSEEVEDNYGELFNTCS